MNLKDKVIEKLKSIEDPELKENVIELELIYDIKIDNGVVTMRFRPTTENCPVGMQLAIAIKKSILSIDDVKGVNLTIENFIWAKETMEFLKSVVKE